MVIDEIFQNALLKAHQMHAGWNRLGKLWGVTWQTINKWSKPEYLGKDVKNDLANKVIEQLRDEYFPKNWTKGRWLKERANIVIIEKGHSSDISDNEHRLLRHFQFLNQDMKDQLLTYASNLVELQLGNDRESNMLKRYTAEDEGPDSMVAEDSETVHDSQDIKQKRSAPYSDD